LLAQTGHSVAEVGPKPCFHAQTLTGRI
jgi:hypothetical protein